MTSKQPQQTQPPAQGGSPLGSETQSAPKNKKLGKNFLMLASLGIFVLIFLLQFIKQGGSLQDEGKIIKAEIKAEEKKIAEYDKRVENPTESASFEVENAKKEAQDLAIKNGTPFPGLPPGVPPNAGVFPPNVLPGDAGKVIDRQTEKIETAYRAIEESRRKNNQSTGNTGGSVTGGSGVIGGAGGAGSSEQLSSEEQRKPPGFLSYAPAPKKETFQPPTATQEEINNASLPGYRAGEPPQATAARRQAQNMANAQGAQPPSSGQANGAAKPVTEDGNSAWLVNTKATANTNANAANLKSQRIVGKNIIFAGSIINAVLEQAIDTSLPGAVRARVTNAIYDSKTASELLIPRGSLMIGKYRNSTTDGQTRILIAFDRLITPSGVQLQLGNMSASDVLGVSGVEGELHTFFFKRLGIATLLAVEGAFIEKKVGPVGTFVAQSGQGQATGSASGQIILQTANKELERQYAIPPKITLPPGAPISVIATENIELTP
jgi:type IV secretion system protein VirB10